jgi:hypothetical protein
LSVLEAFYRVVENLASDYEKTVKFHIGKIHRASKDNGGDVWKGFKVLSSETCFKDLCTPFTSWFRKVREFMAVFELTWLSDSIKLSILGILGDHGTFVVNELIPLLTSDMIGKAMKTSDNKINSTMVATWWLISKMLECPKYVNKK